VSKPKYLKLGEYSLGTLREEDIFACTISALNGIRLSKKERKTVQEIEREIRKYYAASNDTTGSRHFAISDWIEVLDNILDEHCPPYCYWGSIEGDGACIGVWVSIDSLMEDESCGEICRMEKVEDGYRGFIVDVSDHGNVTLIERRPFGHGYKDVVLWAVV
jgi:hypothetical protein